MTKAALLALAALNLIAAPAWAQNYDCQTRGYCTNELECSDDDERFTIRARADGTSDFGWVEAFQFNGKPIRRGGFTVWFVVEGEGSVQTLVLSDNGVDATFSVVLNISRLYHSIQALTCAPAR